MEINLQYSSSDGNHPIKLSLEEIKVMLKNNDNYITKSLPSGKTKTVTISGNKEELLTLSQLLNRLAQKL